MTRAGIELAGPRPCFLGVERSLSGKRWEARLAGGGDRTALAMAQRLGLPEVVARILAGRGVEIDHAERYLAPSLRSDMPDPGGLKDMEVAAERLCRAVMAGERVALFADYDVDGATSAALLYRLLAAVGQPPRIYIPDRIDEGYGPNVSALARLREEGHGLIVCLDCGTTAFEALEAAAAQGTDVLVIDHHEAEPRLPPATAVVNPNRVDESRAYGQLAAVGVTFLLCVALNRALRTAGHYQGERREPDLRRWLDLVALGTVCDVVPLTGVNRSLVLRGLEVLAQRRNVGLSALSDVAGLDEKPTPFHLGYVLGPRINAGGRVGEAGMGARLLTTEDPGEAAEIARRLDSLNAERKAIEEDVLAEALAQAEAYIAASGAPEGLVFVAGEGWHPGVIGIVASRLMERYDLPALVIGLDEAGVGKGSGRSVRGVDLGGAVIAARQAGLLLAGGGHAMAAGLSVERSGLDALRSFLSERLSRALTVGGVAPSLGFDGTVEPLGATVALLQSLETAGPFGAGNAEPRFVVAHARLAKADVVGNGHVRCFVQGAGGGRLKAIAFRAMDGPLGPALLQHDGAALHLAGKLRLDQWSGRDSVQLIMEDAAHPL